MINKIYNVMRFFNQPINKLTSKPKMKHLEMATVYPSTATINSQTEKEIAPAPLRAPK